jgi:hypothetical protein
MTIFNLLYWRKFEEIRAELSLRFKILNLKSMKNEEDEKLEVFRLFSAQYQGKYGNCERIGHKSFQCKNCPSHNCGNNGNTIGGNYFYYCFKSGHIIQSCFKLKNGHNQAGDNNNGNRRRIRRSFVALSKMNRIFPKTIYRFALVEVFLLPFMKKYKPSIISLINSICK